MVVDGGVVGYLKRQRKNTMRPTRGMIQVVRGDNFILNPLIVVLHAVLGVVAFKDEQIFHRKLIIFIPSDTEAFFVCLVFELLRRIEQIKYLFVVDLEKGAGD